MLNSAKISDKSPSKDVQEILVLGEEGRNRELLPTNVGSFGTVAASAKAFACAEYNGLIADGRMQSYYDLRGISGVPVGGATRCM